MSKKIHYYEDLELGFEVVTDELLVTLDMIKDFAEKYDPQDLHMDEEKARESIVGRLVGSAWHTAALTIKLVVDAKPLGDTQIIGLEVNDFKIPAPLLPGDTIHVKGTITKLWQSKTKPYGFFNFHAETFNQRGEKVLNQVWTVIVPRRD